MFPMLLEPSLSLCAGSAFGYVETKGLQET